MTLIGHYKLDNQNDANTTLVDSSGHANNHDGTVYNISTEYDGFNHKVMRTDSSPYATSFANSSDFDVGIDMAVCAWVQLNAVPGVVGANPQCLGGYGNNGATEADNLQWSLYISGTAKIGMYWEYGSSPALQTAWSTADALDLDSNGFCGQDHMIHIGCIRSNGDGNCDVEFYINGQSYGSSQTGLTLPSGGSSGHLDLFRSPKISHYSNVHVASFRVYDTNLVNMEDIYNAEKTTYEHSYKVGNQIIGFGTRWEQGGGPGTLYTPVHTGTMLDEISLSGVSSAGWESERP
jgi:hypothetical protein